VDGPPGIGCPVISASAGADLALLVVEPTVSGIHDLERILATTDHFGVPALVCINKADVNLKRALEVETFCASRGIEVVGRIPFDTVVTEAMVRGQPVTAYTACPEPFDPSTELRTSSAQGKLRRRDGPVMEALRRVWERLKMYLGPERSEED
jgi:MinD superfamily P-loop ATPase